ncbi:hypothetical protein [Stenotrophomonas maltophilia]|uniref:hypothetical protein n=1 Tax=Stenotrophomonas maltophilia TaxID=40324 RepID=UPI001F5322F8|nr:hypothetical protein [Stenotrophomonas maltophilia]MCI1124804.1 hypothetical protein [Stenotrophomonas maltophilia]
MDACLAQRWAPIRNRGFDVKEQLIEFGAGVAKVAPPATVAVAAQAGQIDPQSILIWLSLVYTGGLLVQLLVNNWTKWTDGLGRAWAWVVNRVRRG